MTDIKIVPVEDGKYIVESGSGDQKIQTAPLNRETAERRAREMMKKSSVLSDFVVKTIAMTIIIVIAGFALKIKWEYVSFTWIVGFIALAAFMALFRNS